MPAPPGNGSEARILASVLSDSRVQDCLWVGLMEWELKIEKVALRPRFDAEGGPCPSGWVLCVGLGPGVRLEASADRDGRPVDEVRLIVAREAAPGLVRRSWRQSCRVGGGGGPGVGPERRRPARG